MDSFPAETSHGLYACETLNHLWFNLPEGSGSPLPERWARFGPRPPLWAVAPAKIPESCAEAGPSVNPAHNWFHSRQRACRCTITRPKHAGKPQIVFHTKRRPNPSDRRKFCSPPGLHQASVRLERRVVLRFRKFHATVIGMLSYSYERSILTCIDLQFKKKLCSHLIHVAGYNLWIHCQFGSMR